MSDSEELQTELHEWLESLDYVLANRSPEEVQHLLHHLQARAAEAGVAQPYSATTA